MSDEHYIINEPLPVNQNFSLLKEEALAYIQKLSDTEWTNLNASDPGITIVDQVCYALTELGYCADFSMEDILTQKNQEIEFGNQFYLPQQILTTAPVTIVDYRKYLIDGVQGIRNVVMEKCTVLNPFIRFVYKTKLYLDPEIKSKAIRDSICKEAYYYLNKSRNLNELFLHPVAFNPVVLTLKGNINVKEKTNFSTLLTALQKQIDDFIFPQVNQYGYYQLEEQGFDASEIFNGPALNNGWINTAELGNKRNSIEIRDLLGLIDAVSGITSVDDLILVKDGDEVSKTYSQENEIIYIDVISSFNKDHLLFFNNNKRVIENPNLAKFENQLTRIDGTDALFGTNLKDGLRLPYGKFRDINSYYSIQNTFPEIFSVGQDSISSGASDFQIAQSRQLKGYLTLFDQVLANQFSQLANTDKLLSFGNAQTGTPSDEYAFFAKKDSYQKEHLEYPVPYKVFSPTYFYQSLYDVPHIRPLLKDNDTYRFSSLPESDKLLTEQSWKDYKNDPYNAYIHGLMNLMEDEKINLERRNRILDHLLARHGESSALINFFIEGSKYSGDDLKDTVVYKSLYLQNLGVLSYYRYKAYNFLGANPILKNVEDISFTKGLPSFDDFESDFIFDSGYVDGIEKIHDSNVINYSGVELAVSLLLGLKPTYRDFIVSKYEHLEPREEVELAYWMLNQKKGIVGIEKSLLLSYVQVHIVLADLVSSDTCWSFSTSFDYKVSLEIGVFLAGQSENDIREIVAQGYLIIDKIKYHLVSTNKPVTDFRFYTFMDNSGYYLGYWYGNGTPPDEQVLFDVLSTDFDLILPSFIPQMNTGHFKDKLSMVADRLLPVQIGCRKHYLDKDLLRKFIKVYIPWHNDLIYNSGVYKPDASAVFDLLIEIYAQ